MKLTVIDALLTPNPFSRPQTGMLPVKGVVIHWVANPGTGAAANRNYFENLAKTRARYASSHYLVGLAGEILRCVPENEIAYHAGEANRDYIGIECCHPDAGGQFSEKTTESLIALSADILARHGAAEVLRHFDVTGKYCPKYYVAHPTAWEALTRRIAEKRETLLAQSETEALLDKMAGQILFDRTYWQKILNGEEAANPVWLKALLGRLTDVWEKGFVG
ncbi:MAG: N-acetylmuramoyl-L-alanine amidase [Clostridiales bacterium]|jgi:N-acetylmuramoyl-L-alanine amidase CwlA|nr:N-acetylmuramoyl-L-alanine amidase [Clostridiales bacterium]